MADRKSTCSTALVIACVLTVSAPDTLARADLECETRDAHDADWRICRAPPRRAMGMFCISCARDERLSAPRYREFAADLGDEDVLLFLAYGVSQNLSSALDDAAWRQQWLTLAHRATRPSPFALQSHDDVFAEHRHRGDLTGYLATVLPSTQVHEGAHCRDCRFNLAMGMIWGYRWSSLSGRIVTETDMNDLTHAQGYGFRYLYRASPGWRYVLQIGRDDETLDLLGEARWRIRPDAYLSVTGAFGERGSSSVPKSDFKLYFSFD